MVPRNSAHRRGKKTGNRGKIVGLSVAGTFFAIAAALATTIDWDPCEVGACSPPPHRGVHRAYLFDATNIPTPNQMSVIRTSVLSGIESLKAGDTVCLYMLQRHESGPLKELMCGERPLRGKEVSRLNDNPKKRQAEYAHFEKKIEAALDAVASVKEESDGSPIIEAIWHLGQNKASGKVREVEIWSDMVNKSSIVDHFRPPYGHERLNRSYASDVAGLEGAQVTVHQLVVNSKFQTEALTDWWGKYWSKTGMKVASHELIQP